MDFKDFWNIKISLWSHLLPIISSPLFSLFSPHQTPVSQSPKPTPTTRSPLQFIGTDVSGGLVPLVGLGLLSFLIHPNQPLPSLNPSLSVGSGGSGSLGWVGSSLVLTPPSLTLSSSESLSVRCGGGGLVPLVGLVSLGCIEDLRGLE